MYLDTELFTSDVAPFYQAAIVLLLTLLYFTLQARGLPPGPTGVPFFGYWPFLKIETCHQQLLEIGRKYGDVSSFTVTGHFYINLSTHKAIREALQTKTEFFVNRARDFNLLRQTFESSFAFSEGEEWKIMRKYYVQMFKEQGLTNFKESTSGSIYDAVAVVVKDLEKTKGEPVDITEIVLKGSNQIMRCTLFAGDESITDEEFSSICNSYFYVLEYMNGPNMLAIGTFARYFILPFTKGYRLGNKHQRLMEKLVYDMINTHKSSYNEANPRGDVIDRFFKEKRERENHNDPTAKYFTDKALMGSLNQFIGDGLLTVAVFVSALFKALVEHPEEQEKINEELVEVVGQDREPCIEDKSRLSYTNAFILEVVRTCDIFPFIPNLVCSKKTSLQGYKIPEGSVLLVNSWAANHDPKEYEEPTKFSPSRFIVEKGQKKPEAPILFGFGKRACIGEGFSMAQAFLFLTTIVKHFRLTKSKEDSCNKLLFIAGKMEICAVPRDQK